MCCHNADRSFGCQVCQYGFGDCAAHERFGACAELINEEQGLPVGVLHKGLHVPQVRRIGTQVIGYRLLVAYIDEDIAKQPCAAAFLDGNQQSALQHILGQCHCFQAYRFAAGVGSGDDQDTCLVVVHA